MNAPRGQPLVNLIISATPDKRRRQNVIPARSRLLFLVSNFKWCRYSPRSCILPHLAGLSFFSPLCDIARRHHILYLIPIFFPFAVSEHRRSFIDTLQSVARTVKFDKKNVTRRCPRTSGPYVCTRMCAGDKINGNFLVRHARFAEGHCDLYSRMRQQTLAIRLGEWTDIRENIVTMADFTSTWNSKFDVRCVSKLVSVSTT